jgi:hypothetical protein
VTAAIEALLLRVLAVHEEEFVAREATAVYRN